MERMGSGPMCEVLQCVTEPKQRPKVMENAISGAVLVKTEHHRGFCAEI